jgi:hypothetical protein
MSIMPAIVPALNTKRKSNAHLRLSMAASTRRGYRRRPGQSMDHAHRQRAYQLIETNPAEMAIEPRDRRLVGGVRMSFTSMTRKAMTSRSSIA